MTVTTTATAASNSISTTTSTVAVDTEEANKGTPKKLIQTLTQRTSFDFQ